MNTSIISFNTAFSAVCFLQDQLGHRRLWITKFYVGFNGIAYCYALVDWDHRVLADWNEETCQWDLRQDAWTVVPDSRDYLPEDVLTEVISEVQLFQLSTVEGFL
ncbi:hypothetical protein ACR2Q2_19390 [Pectobacterium versatile]|uniref:hypothetical protein n=1 Tax=Pectobacterium versatile TaxID=2488639 RepID=UPI000B7BBC29|nr:hypothetical protein [Pectobacterium versatile]ASN85120.1 Hypothetical protein SCC1_1682 [Pectobacterium versatile]MBQ4765375.1 hypothetical protein [Pectobacterium versatile]POY55555.1 hypothetical protein F018LOC_01485 [Pectobacterium versatile]POY58958.1 hypothetical protein PB70LOC_02315 [Pectobacterium versatile]POY62059.1 hypothetical protein PB69LOC_02846 [Pectobacterium versatile]